MRFEATRQARDIIDDHGEAVTLLLTQIGQHGFHAGTIRKTARHIVGKHLHHL